jgi:hypothetical protein
MVGIDIEKKKKICLKISFFIFSIKERTYSFWNYVLQNVNDFKNPLFRPQSSYASEVLLPIINPQTLRYISL